jgi:microcystin-dependent protein
MFAGNFPPNGWMDCSGQLLAIADYDVLFQLIGTTYGGDGESTFALPNLQSRVPVHQGQGAGLSNHLIGEQFGVESVTLTTNQIPQHAHNVTTTAAAATTNAPSNTRSLADEASTASGGNAFVYAAFNNATTVNLNAQSIGSAGGSQPHDNIQPILCIRFIISLFGVFPSQN